METSFTVTIDPKVLMTSEWHLFNSPEGVTYPRLYKIADGNAKLYMRPGSVHVYISGFSALGYGKPAQQNHAAPNSGISESMFLKALAISQRPELARDLI